jgi:hypothetical protein
LSDNDNDGLVKAIRSADMDVLLPQLLGAAQSILRRLCWAGGADYQPSAMETRELVNETLTRIFEDEQCPQFDGDLRAAIVSAMTSVSTSTVKKLRRVNLKSEIESPQPTEESGDGDEAVLEAMGELVATSGDAELLDYFLGIEYYGPERASIARGLGWTPDKVSVVKKRLKRLLTKSNFTVRRRKVGNE